MKFDVLGLLAACSYALDCVEAELIKVTNNHSKRVAYMAVCIAEKMGIQGQSLQDLAECALLHDNAVAQYIQEELRNDVLDNGATKLCKLRLNGTPVPLLRNGYSIFNGTKYR